MAISVQDDGIGMARSNLHCMLSFGFSSKEHVVGNVGRFGIGFKSGSMRIAHDALILTRREGQASAALLSTTFLNAIEADDILIPMFTWTTETSGAGKHTYVASEPSNTAEWEENMSVIEQYTYLASEAAVLRELDKITTPTGTRIVLFNLKDPPEFDFSVKNDVRMLGIDPDEQNRTSARRPVYQQHRPGQQMTLDVPEDYSLRAYMEVLYLRPTVTFSLRGELIEPRCPISRLALEYYKFEDYTPKDLPEERRAPVIVHCGYQEEKSKHCGFHIYNKNRLIRMYQRFGAQLQANAMMKDMLGVVEADCLEPTHNKQAFNTTDVAYQKCQKHLEKCMNDYYFGVQNLRLAGIGAGGKRRIGAPQGGTRKKGKTAGKDGKGQKGKGKGGKKNGSDGDSDDDDAWVARRAKSAAGGKNKLDLRTFFPRVLRKCMSHKNSWAFNEPVDAEYWGVLDYYEIIKTPMDFGTIATKLDAGEYRTEGSAHGPQKFVADVRQVFYNAWTYNTPGHQVYEFAQEVGRIFETELAKAVGDEDVWNLKAGNVLAMCGPAPAKEKPAGALAAGDGDAAAKPEPGAAAFAVDSEAIKAMVETRAAQAIGEANAARDEALAKLHDERAAREVFEAELEAQMAESLRAAREEEKSRYAKLESEKDTLLSALSDSSEMKRMYQERVKALEAEVKALKEKVGEGQVVS